MSPTHSDTTIYTYSPERENTAKHPLKLEYHELEEGTGNRDGENKRERERDGENEREREREGERERWREEENERERERDGEKRRKRGRDSNRGYNKGLYSYT